MDERRLLTALALSLLVVMGYSYLFPPPKPQAPPPVGATIERPTEESGLGGTPERPTVAPVEALPEASIESREDDKERPIEVRTSGAEITFTNRGARIASWKVVQVRNGERRLEEMVRAAPGGPKPLDVETGDPVVDEALRTALFVPSTEELLIDGRGSREGQLVFEYASGALEARKEFGFEGAGSLVSVAISVRRNGQEVAKRILWGPGIGNPTAAEMGVQGYQAAQGVARRGGSVERIAADKLKGAEGRETVSWAGIEGQYFAALFIPAAGQAGRVEFRPAELPPDADGEVQKSVLAAFDLGAGADGGLLYVGVKDYQHLETLGHGLASVVPVGDWIGPIVVPLMKLLRSVEGKVGNYGLAIILLTVVINVLMAPLRHYSIANGLKMAKLAPEMKVIQERYRKVPFSERQGMQEEMAALYGRHGMSMSTQFLVGCLPLVITMPFLIAFYRVLTVSVDLRGAGFLWMSDLSLKDPLYLMPVLMGLSMFLMQRMMPTTMDATQQKMMMLMPLVLAGMFLWAPAGLNLYWLASNLCAIVQQGVTMSVLGRRSVGAERRKR